MSVVSIKSNLGDYTVRFGCSANFIQYIEDKYSNTSYIVDENVWKHYRESSLSSIDNKSPVILPISEDRKNISTVMDLYDQFIDRAVKRNMILISIGGGIVQDITGFFASTLYRGIKWIYLPTISSLKV